MTGIMIDPVSGSSSGAGATGPAGPTGPAGGAAFGGFVDPTFADYQFFGRKAGTRTTAHGAGAGDSIMAGTVITTAPTVELAAGLTFGPVTTTVDNYGMSGAVSADWNASGTDLATMITGFATNGVPDFVIYAIGTNDSEPAHAPSKATFRQNVLEFIDAMLGAGVKRIYLAKPPYLYTSASPFDGASQGLLVDYCAAMDDLIDNDHVFAVALDDYLFFQANPSYIKPDGIHPTQTGSDARVDASWIPAIKPYINGLISSPLVPMAFDGTFTLTHTSGVYVVSGGGGLNFREDSPFEGTPITATTGQDEFILDQSPFEDTLRIYELISSVWTRLQIGVDYHIVSGVPVLVTPASSGDSFWVEYWSTVAAAATTMSTSAGLPQGFDTAYNSGITYSNTGGISDDTATYATASWTTLRAKTSHTSGLRWATFKVVGTAGVTGDIIVGAITATETVHSTYLGDTGGPIHGYGLYGSTTAFAISPFSGASTSGAVAFGAGDEIMVEMRHADGKGYVRTTAMTAGTYVGGGSPVTGTSPTFTFTPGADVMPAISLFASSGTLTALMNTGQITPTDTPSVGFSANG